MSKKKDTPKRRNSSTKKDPLAGYKERARKILDIYFSADTPEFVRDLLSSWLSQLEQETQVYFNVQEIADVALPLMLQEADRRHVAAESPSSPIVLAALIESESLNRMRGNE